ncbi:hypothetical protein ANCCAN_14881 [Ancylostoma caninum]|uniref:Uncharacterized protein n=1 Tax=Ancylostoma caninum TaxID=29170 RepID=A0A368G8Y0_ANCCA|nr:hypothetical protein ANCCAN_14881 [Ancylostoma caninum]
MRILAIIRLLWRRIKRTRRGKMIVNARKHKVYLRTVLPTYISFCRPLPPSILTETVAVKETECRLYAVSSCSSDYEATHREESEDDEGYARIPTKHQSLDDEPRENYKPIGGLRRVDACSNLLDKSFYMENCSQMLQRIGSIRNSLLTKVFAPPPQFIPICTSTPLSRSCSDIPATSAVGTKLHFRRVLNKHISVPTIKPPPLPIEEHDGDTFVVLDGDGHKFWELEIPRGDESVDHGRAASSETTLLLEAESTQQLNETFIEEVTIYTDLCPEPPHAANKTFIFVDKAASLLWSLFMSKSIAV